MNDKNPLNMFAVKKTLIVVVALCLMAFFVPAEMASSSRSSDSNRSTKTTTVTPTPIASKTPAVKTPKPAKPKKRKPKATPSPTPTLTEEQAASESVEEDSASDAEESSQPEMGLSVDEILKRVDKSQAAMKDVEMELKMEMKDSLSGTKQQVRGLVRMKNPGRVWAHYTHPIEQFLFVKGDRVRMYQPAQNMVYQQKGGSSGKGGEPVYLGVGHELKQYMAISRVSISKETGEEVTLLFVPRSQQGLFDRMKVTINKRTWWPYKIEMKAPSADTKATFQKFRFNQGMEDSLFEFTPPSDAQIVEGAVF